MAFTWQLHWGEWKIFIGSIKVKPPRDWGGGAEPHTQIKPHRHYIQYIISVGLSLSADLLYRQRKNSADYLVSSYDLRKWWGQNTKMLLNFVTVSHTELEREAQIYLYLLGLKTNLTASLSQGTICAYLCGLWPIGANLVSFWRTVSNWLNKL